MQILNKLATLLYVFTQAVAKREKRNEHGNLQTDAVQAAAVGHEQDYGGFIANVSLPCTDDTEDSEHYFECSPGTASCTEPRHIRFPNHTSFEFDECFLGKGCSGKVWAGRCARQMVAVKAQAKADRNLCEAHLMQKFAYGGLLKGFANFEEPGNQCLYTVMEYASHGDLNHHLTDDKQSPWTMKLSELGRIFYETLLALLELHDAGVVHRDIKPTNIFMSADRLGYIHPKIGDFGFACYYKEMGPGQSGPCSRCVDSAGSLVYMSPSYVESGWEVGVFPADDLWSMGKVLLQIVYRSKDEVRTDIEKEMLREKYNDTFFMKEALVRTNLVSEEMKKSAPLNQMPGVHELLEFLLCSGCSAPDGAARKMEDEGVAATQKAISLTKTWLMKDFGFDQEKLDRIAKQARAPREIADECRNLHTEEVSLKAQA